MPTAASAFAAPAKVTIANLLTADTLTVQYNPVTLHEELEPVWNELQTFGQSHPQLQYQGTKAHHFPSLAFTFDRLVDQGAGTRYDTKRARNFILAFAYASRAASKDVASGAPPNALFVWPNLISMRCIVGKIICDTDRLGLDGTPTGFKFTLELKEARSQRLYMEDVLQFGTQRPSLGTSTGA